MPAEFFLTTVILLVATACIATMLVLFRRSQHFDIDETRRLQEKLSDAARQIENQKQKIAQMNSEARTDPLTQLPNLGALEEELARRAAEVVRYELQVSLLVVDIEKFKRINHEFGEPVGDMVLQHLSEIIRTQTRACDFSARMHDDVFAVVLGHTPIQNAHVVADRLKTSIESVEFPASASTPIDLRAFVGVAELSADYQRSLEQAKLALREAKHRSASPIVVFGQGTPPRAEATV